MRVQEAVAAENLNRERPGDRYDLDPRPQTPPPLPPPPRPPYSSHPLSILEISPIKSYS